MSNEHTEARGAGPAQMGCLKFWPAKRALSPSSSSILVERHQFVKTQTHRHRLSLSRLLFDSPEQLVVLGQALRSARCTCLDLEQEANDI